MIRPQQTKGRVEDREARYRRLVDMLPDAILVYCGGKCVFANAAAARLFGAASSKKMLGHDVNDLTHPDFREIVQQRINFAHGGEPEQLQEIKILRLDGHPVDVEIMALAINYQGLPAIQMVLRDLTFSKLTEKALPLSQIDRLEAFVGLARGIAHDFNNVLMAILGNIDLAALAAPDNGEVRDRLAAAEQGCCQAQTLVQQLQILAKGGTPTKKPQDLVKIINEAARLAVTCSKSWVEFSLPEQLWQVEANLGQMYQVFGNLFINAAQAMPAGGMIRVQAKNLNEPEALDQSLPARRYVIVTVADQGTGIAPEHLSKVFDPGFTTKPQGSGLGLATVCAIVKNHYGHIAVESTLGGGAAFRVFLPASDQKVIQPPKESK